MSGSSGLSSDLNADLHTRKSLIDFIKSADISELSKLNCDWQSGIVQSNNLAFQIFEGNGFVEKLNSEFMLSRSGRLFLSRILIQFPKIEGDSGLELNDTYQLIERLRVGKNSAVYVAEHKLLGTKVVAKILRPGASENIIESLQLLSKLDVTSNVVRPTDLFRIDHTDVFGRPVELHCVIYPFVEGISLREFLSQKSYHLNSHVAVSFIRQVGAALENLERLGAYHGDLHDENILVEEASNGQLHFKLIDVSFGAMGSLTAEECKNSDLSHFRQHLWRIITLQKSFIPRMSLRKFLGTNQFRKINQVLSGDFSKFSEVMEFMSDNAEQLLFEDKRRQFVNEKFGQPTTFRLQRYEEIIDPSEAARLFVPFPELMSKVKDFSNTFISGTRGSGKSTYLAALGFFPHSKESHVDFREIFGVYFPCRQGEFKSITGGNNWSVGELQEYTSFLMTVKIIRRTLETIWNGAKSGKIQSPSSYEELRTFLNRFVPAPGIVSVESDLLPDLENFASTMVRVEIELLSTDQIALESNAFSSGSTCLISFFEVIQRTFSELSSTRFHLLFDDAGYPNLSRNVQNVVCDLILTSNPVFCIKFTAERFTFDFKSSHGKVPENGHDYFGHDISQILFVGPDQQGIRRANLEKYFRDIVEQRLQHFGYSSHSIIDYLGDNIHIGEQLIGLLAASRRDARYAGWTAVWNIAERTPRNLLEIVSEIFSFGEVEKNSPAETISLRNQNLGIRTISHKRLQSLSQIAGSISVGGQSVSLGRKLFEVTASIGSIFRIYLRQEKGKKRKRQILAIERNDLVDLTSESKEILEKLISFGVLDDTRTAYSRDDGILKPVYVLNRMYCPAFDLTYRRDEHLRVSRKKFELLLLDPESFVKMGTRRLAKVQSEDVLEEGLFGFKIYE